MLAGALRRRFPPPSPSPHPPSPSCLVAQRRLRHRSVALWFFGWWVGFCPLPPALVRSLPVGIGMLWGIPGFCLPWVPYLLWGLSRPMTIRPPLCFLFESSHPAMTQLLLPLRWGSSRPGTIRPPRPLRGRSSHPETIRPPLPLLGSSSRVIPPLQRPQDPPHPIPLRGDRGPLQRPRSPHSFPTLPRVLLPPIPAGLLFFPLLPPRPMAAPRLPLVGRRGGAFPAIAPAGPHIPP